MSRPPTPTPALRRWLPPPTLGNIPPLDRGFNLMKYGFQFYEWCQYLAGAQTKISTIRLNDSSLHVPAIWIVWCCPERLLWDPCSCCKLLQNICNCLLKLQMMPNQKKSNGNSRKVFFENFSHTSIDYEYRISESIDIKVHLLFS